jgi:SAM-dependent methyltransferase
MPPHDKKDSSDRRPWDVKQIAALYEAEFQKYGYHLASLMIPKGASDARFKVKFEIGDLDQSRILDVGCGFGHMLDHLKAWGIKARYTGIDILPGFIEIARKRHPGADFRVLNILEDPVEELWDWVFLVGAFNVAPKQKKWWRYVQAMVKKMFELSTQGVAADFLSSYVDFKKNCSFHADPEQVFSFAKTLTKRVVLRHDYMAYEFTVYLYKNQSLTKNNIFSAYKKNIPPEPTL